MAKPFRVGLVGFGNIGTGLVRHFRTHGDLIAQRLGFPLELAMIADRDFDNPPRDEKPPASAKLTTNWKDITDAKDIDAVVELVGVGRDGKPTLALEIAKAALSSGKHFVTANKGLIAPHGGELHELAAKNNVLCLYEASVGAGIPLIASMQNSLVGDQITGVHGIVNGTCNYILTKLEADPSIPMSDMIAEAQRLGYAEPDPTFDVGGHDSAYKIVILSSLAFGQGYKFEDVRLEGITTLGEPEFRYAKQNGLVLKLLASATQRAGGAADLAVGPAFVPAGHVIAGVRDVFNAILVVAEPIGETMYYGRGAGQGSTASGLIADLVLAARATATGAPNPYPLTIPNSRGKVASADSTKGRHYFRVDKSLRDKISGKVVDESANEVSIVTGPISNTELDQILGKQPNPAVKTHVRFVLED